MDPAGGILFGAGVVSYPPSEFNRIQWNPSLPRVNTVTDNLFHSISDPGVQRAIKWIIAHPFCDCSLDFFVRSSIESDMVTKILTADHGESWRHPRNQETRRPARLPVGDGKRNGPVRIASASRYLSGSPSTPDSTAGNTSGSPHYGMQVGEVEFIVLQLVTIQ